MEDDVRIGLGKPGLLLALVCVQPFFALYANNLEEHLPSVELVAYRLASVFATIAIYATLQTALSLTTPRLSVCFAGIVTETGARLATGRAGSPLAGRDSHPLDD